MNKIIIKTIFYFGLISLVVITLNRTIPTTSQREKQIIDSLLVNKDTIESLTFGRSHAGALNYMYWGKKGFNLALGGRDFASINYLLKFLVPKMKKLNEVIIFISYSSFYYDNTALSEGNLNDARKALYFSVPSYKIISKSDISNYVFGKFFPFIQADHGYSLLKKSLFSDSDRKSVFWRNWNDKFMDSTELIRSAVKQAKIHSGDRISALRYSPNVISENKEILIEIIKYLKNNNIKIIFVTSPYSTAYTKMFPKKDIIEMKNIMNTLSIQYKVDYFDYSNDSLISNDNKYFHNADHLNEKGKEKFTKELLLEISKR